MFAYGKKNNKSLQKQRNLGFYSKILTMKVQNDSIKQKVFHINLPPHTIKTERK